MQLSVDKKSDEDDRDRGLQPQSSEFRDQIARSARAVCRVFGFNSENATDSTGTGFVISSGRYVVTAAHVVRSSDNVVVASSGPSAWVSEGTVIRRNLDDDIAIVELATIAPTSIQLTLVAQGVGAGPLICWQDSTTSVADTIASKLALKEIPVMWISEVNLKSAGDRPRAILTGSFRKGMSGGPVYSPLLDAVIGIVSALPPFDPYSVTDAWRYHARDDEGYAEAIGADVGNIIEKVLENGIGLAVSALYALQLLRDVES